MEKCNPGLGVGEEELTQKNRLSTCRLHICDGTKRELRGGPNVIGVGEEKPKRGSDQKVILGGSGEVNRTKARQTLKVDGTCLIKATENSDRSGTSRRRAWERRNTTKNHRGVWKYGKSVQDERNWEAWPWRNRVSQAKMITQLWR